MFLEVKMYVELKKKKGNDIKFGKGVNGVKVL